MKKCSYDASFVALEHVDDGLRFFAPDEDIAAVRTRNHKLASRAVKVDAFHRVVVPVTLKVFVVFLDVGAFRLEKINIVVVIGADDFRPVVTEYGGRDVRLSLGVDQALRRERLQRLPVGRDVPSIKEPHVRIHARRAEHVIVFGTRVHAINGHPAALRVFLHEEFVGVGLPDVNGEYESVFAAGDECVRLARPHR